MSIEDVYGCYNRKTRPSYWVKCGLHRDSIRKTAIFRMNQIPDTGSRECQYTKTAPTDTRCLGCCHQEK